MVNNKTPCVIVKVIADYDYIYHVIDYDYGYSASGNVDYDYLKSCNRLQSITIADYDFTKPGLYTDAELECNDQRKNIKNNLTRSLYAVVAISGFCTR